MTRGPVSALFIALVLSLGVTAATAAQSLSSAPAPSFDPAISPFTLRSNPLFDVAGPPEGGPHVGGPDKGGAHATSMFEAGQIVDRPTGDLRPRFHWGLFGSVIPHWSTPRSLGAVFFEDVASAQMNGRDLRIGVVRGRQLGFEMGVSFVQKSLTSFTIIRQGPPTGSPTTTHTYTPLDTIKMSGVDSHLVIPIARIGERVQIGILAGGGIAWIPDAPIRKQIEGPPFYAAADSTVALSSPPAAGGYVREFGESGDPVPLVPGTTHGVAQTSVLAISGTDYVWPLFRGQLAADFLLARPLKVRVAAGFHYPGVQALGVDVVYLFRTGRLDPARTPSPPNDTGAAATAGQIADRPQVIAPRRSYWGVLGGAAPFWFTPHWSEFFRDLTPEEPFTLKGREYRIGLTNGRPLGKEFGISFVQKSWTEFSFVREGYPLPIGTTLGSPSGAARITLSQIDPVLIPGLEFHAFVPIDRIGSRVQLGGLLGGGAARVPGTAIQKRIEGPPYVASATAFNGLPTLPPAGGFVLDEDGELFPVAPGQAGATITTAATEISPLGSFLLLWRAQIAADVLIAAPFKVRFSAGFNYPGAQLFNIEAVYMFGTGR